MMVLPHLGTNHCMTLHTIASDFHYLVTNSTDSNQETKIFRLRQEVAGTKVATMDGGLGRAFRGAHLTIFQQCA